MSLICLDMDERSEFVTAVGPDYLQELHQHLGETTAKVEQLQAQLNRIESLLLERLPLIKRLSDDY